jgi:hypothetical protein
VCFVDPASARENLRLKPNVNLSRYATPKSYHSLQKVGVIMLTRRRFLGYGAAGMLAAISGCRPANFGRLEDRNEISSDIDPLLADKAKLAPLKDLLLGYPINMNTPPEGFFAWRRQLRKVGIGDFAYNNVGNPYSHSAIPYNTHDLEREIINRFGKLYGFPQNDIWGFLSHSGTDSNMHGMYMGRTVLKGRTGVIPRCYFTREASNRSLWKHCQMAAWILAILNRK